MIFVKYYLAIGSITFGGGTLSLDGLRKKSAIGNAIGNNRQQDATLQISNLAISAICLNLHSQLNTVSHLHS
jgi:hypothetical protein